MKNVIATRHLPAVDESHRLTATASVLAPPRPAVVEATKKTSDSTNEKNATVRPPDASHHHPLGKYGSDDTMKKTIMKRMMWDHADLRVEAGTRRGLGC